MPPTSESSKTEKSLALFWGCELSQENRSYTFDPLEDGDHKLILNTVCLGEKAKDELNIVEVIPPPDENGKKTPPVPIAMLKPSVLPMANISGMELTPPITLHLRSGSGPVHISGRDLTVTLDLPWEEGERDEDEEASEEEEEASEEEDDADEDSDEISLEASPPKSTKRLASNSQASVAKPGAERPQCETPFSLLSAPTLKSPESKVCPPVEKFVEEEKNATARSLPLGEALAWLAGWPGPPAEVSSGLLKCGFQWPELPGPPPSSERRLGTRRLSSPEEWMPSLTYLRFPKFSSLSFRSLPSEEAGF
ncbi:nucleoplasmin-2 [Gracilinanus agilis]|uniref:nucleoplasmin-2 n=1 Tax=Gracilinanus agilis TaxID=191870 RepID=UPI001CFDC11E|nr:nucleoplasmin-2 [Gracilinanus agilis]